MAFGERLDPEVLAQAQEIVNACAVFLAVGTTLQVQPTAIAVVRGARKTAVPEQ
ncbi:hypothetical protein ACFVFH_04825 [Streptomyces sp. NPDC057697]|uniref:hypothetical protein n=1 Tax=Streptomyces sp. NPDC057697 TaxID=3346219 RepID=UPI0036BFD8AB